MVAAWKIKKCWTLLNVWTPLEQAELFWAKFWYSPLQLDTNAYKEQKKLKS